MTDRSIHNRKDEHIHITLNEQVQGKGISTGFESYRFEHQALPEISFDSIDTSATFLKKQVKVPFLISSMTGGTPRAHEINRNLASAAEEKGWALGLGSSRVALENKTAAASFQLREEAPTIPIFANIGAVQLNYGYGSEECSQIVRLTGADAIVLHLNSMQEIFQDEGDTDFSGLLLKIAKVADALSVPVGIKEVGFGIASDTCSQLIEAGVQFIDTAGAGGTSWIEVEKYRSQNSIKQRAASAFLDWGLPTAKCVEQLSGLPKPPDCLIASGGITNGVEAAKAIALGADMAGYGRSILPEAVDSKEALLERFEQLELELRISMFGIGAQNLEALKNTDRLISQNA
ncbi:type 2 isopentenyl-diphosphate Delta-isomerase [Terribacillus saccharophilus]|uniref:type 2 isopentenyl-diphosphate Delta-isomerase n=1 Tax=Terribacillus saccharophilus TaxID=361277 RepID=UPI002DCA6192|nr:type 2 isopentenyl-diphosphate Delta-isomerase [Terribacillus saccharophilus]MEC0290372.1 type 2 isopentenyl-diphosphate Delta-isomerase [Terribacillus saccharophilus]